MRIVEPFNLLQVINVHLLNLRNSEIRPLVIAITLRNADNERSLEEKIVIAFKLELEILKKFVIKQCESWY